MGENQTVNDQQPPHEYDGPEQPTADNADVEHTEQLPADVEHTAQLPSPFAPPTGEAPGQPAGAQTPRQFSEQGAQQYPQQESPQASGHAGAQSAYAGPYPAQSNPAQSYPGPAQQPGTGSTPQGGGYGGPAPYAGYGTLPPAPAHTGTRKTSKAIWPAVAALSLLIGLLGGAAGGAAWTKWQDDHQEPGRTNSGLGDVDTISTAPLPADNESIAKVAAELLPSTVQIIADTSGEEGGATGSGFFLDKQGHVVTNNHVVAGAAEGGKIMVVDHSGTRHEATLVGRSAVYDLAVLYVKDIKKVQPAALGSSKKLRVGENVVAIGSPLGLSSTVTSGIVSALDRPVTTGGGEDSQSYINAVQTDAAINPGNSGGPLVNIAGQVVGVNSAIATTGGSLGGESGNIGVGFAIPIEQVKVTADQILRDGEARYPVIGAMVKSDDSGTGALIDNVEDNSPAAEGGLKSGDVVTALDDRVITDSPTLIVAIRSHLPGDEVSLTVQRDGKEQQVKVTLDSKVG